MHIYSIRLSMLLFFVDLKIFFFGFEYFSHEYYLSLTQQASILPCYFFILSVFSRVKAPIIQSTRVNFLIYRMTWSCYGFVKILLINFSFILSGLGCISHWTASTSCMLLLLHYWIGASIWIHKGILMNHLSLIKITILHKSLIIHSQIKWRAHSRHIVAIFITLWMHFSNITISLLLQFCFLSIRKRNIWISLLVARSLCLRKIPSLLE